MKKIFFTAILAMAAASTWADVEINETTFPDENFRNWVLAQPYGQDGVLTDEEIADVTTVNVTGNRIIQSLKGIECFTALTSLECGLNQLTALDLSKNTALTSLYCYCNQLTTLDLSDNTALEHLECWENQLASLDVSTNAKLVYMACHRNQLASLDVTGNIALTSLCCGENRLTSLDVSKNTELTELNCTDNQLASLDVSRNTALTLLFCSRNQLTTLNVSACTALENLRCDENRLSTLEVSGCSELEEILCYSNQINGGAMDALVEGLPVTRSECGHLPVISLEGEQNVMTKSQVAAARAKGWRPRYKYGSFSTMGWTDYEGSDDATTLASPLGETGEGAAYDLQGRKLPLKGVDFPFGRRALLGGSAIYIQNGRKVLEQHSHKQTRKQN